MKKKNIHSLAICIHDVDIRISSRIRVWKYKKCSIFDSRLSRNLHTYYISKIFPKMTYVSCNNMSEYNLKIFRTIIIVSSIKNCDLSFV